MGRLMKGIHPEMTEKKEGGLKLYFLRWCRLYLLGYVTTNS